MLLKYAYLTGCLFLFFFWLIIFLTRKKLRQEMIWASSIGLPFGFIDFFLIPQYWHPDVIFDFGIKKGFGLESFLFFSLMTGIASVIYEFIEKKGIRKNKKDKHSHFSALIFSLSLFIILATIFPDKNIYNLMISLFTGGILVIFLRPDLSRQIITSGFIFAFFYFFIFLIINQIFLQFVSQFYNMNNLWNVIIIGVPLEEILVAFVGGMFWSALYEYANAYSEK